MKQMYSMAAAIFAGLLLVACASSDVTQQTKYEGELAKPNRIIVHDFAGTPDDIPAGSAIANLIATRETPQSPEEIELGRQLGQQVAAKLVEDIQEMGMPAERAAGAPPPALGDGVIMGQFVTVDEGSRLKRMLIGFGAGAADLKTLAEAFVMTQNGLQPVGSAEIEAGGGKMPGMLVPVGAGAVADRALTSAVVSGSLNVVKEIGPESIEAAAERTADEIAELLRKAFEKRGWI